MAESFTFQARTTTASQVHELRNALIGEGAANTSDVHTVLTHGLTEFTTFDPETAEHAARNSITEVAGYRTEQGGQAVSLELNHEQRAHIAGLLTRTAFGEYSSLEPEQQGLLIDTARAGLPVLSTEAHASYDTGLHTKLVINPDQS